MPTNGQETRPILYHHLGVWYVTSKGVKFRLYEPPTRTFGPEGYHHGHVEICEPHAAFDTLQWDPRTTRRAESWWQKLLGLRNPPILRAPAAEEKPNEGPEIA